MYTRIAYWSLQLAIWLIGINIWYQQSNETNVQLMPILATPLTFWPHMVVTLFCSLALLILYVPSIRLFRWLLEARNGPMDGLVMPRH
jgi:hypothetical protein